MTPSELDFHSRFGIIRRPASSPLILPGGRELGLWALASVFEGGEGRSPVRDRVRPGFCDIKPLQEICDNREIAPLFFLSPRPHQSAFAESCTTVGFKWDSVIGFFSNYESKALIMEKTDWFFLTKVRRKMNFWRSLYIIDVSIEMQQIFC